MQTNGYKTYQQLTPDEKLLAELLCSGSDERSKLNNGQLNKYGGTSFPRQTIAFGSCTNSTISPRGWETAKQALAAYEALASECGETLAAETIGQNIQAQLLALMELSEIAGLKVVLTPSGTDAESIAVYLAALFTDKPIVNIIIGAREVGSGTALAAAARYFSELTPAGNQREIGTALDTELAARIAVQQIKIRVDNSIERTPEDLDLEIREWVKTSLAKDQYVMLHIVAHSKTGVHAPRLETMNELIAEYGQRIIPIIDAAQGRFSRRGLRDYLARGFMVILTGSKFYGGPPFSGCLLIPQNYLPANQVNFSFPAGFADYLTPAQLPADWQQARQSLPATINKGLLLRWQVALAEITAYYAASDTARYQVLRFFEARAPFVLGRSPLLELINPPIPLFDDVTERLLESKTTVYSFRIITSQISHTQLDQATLGHWVEWLNQDISAFVSPTATRQIHQAASTCFQLGQAVHIGDQASGAGDYVIRVAIGGVLIVQVATDTSLGETLAARLNWLEQQLESLRIKIEFIASHATTIPNISP